MRAIFFVLVFTVALAAKAQHAVAPCYATHGRLSFYNGTPSTRIWIVGTRRMLGVRQEEDGLPANARALLTSFDDNIFGDFVVCPLTRRKPGVMQIVYVKSATRLIDRKIPSE